MCLKPLARPLFAQGETLRDVPLHEEVQTRSLAGPPLRRPACRA